MNKRYHFVRFSILLCWMLLTCGVGIGVPHNVAHAAALPSGYSLTLTESTSTMTYGDTAPTFQAQLTVPAGEDPLTSPAEFTFKIGTHSFAPDGHDASGSTYTFALNGSTVSANLTLSVGSYTVVANYFSSVLNQTLTSALVTLTVQKSSPALSCQMSTAALWARNTSIIFVINEIHGLKIDWQNATYSVTFIGAQTFTRSNVTAKNVANTAQGTVLTPPVGGVYHFQCTFNGTTNANAAESPLSNSPLTVTDGHQASIKLHSTPATITAGTNATLDISVSGGSGLPTPTGEIVLFLSVYTSTNRIPLTDGQVTVQIVFPAQTGSTMQICYYGDTVYAQSCPTFSLSNPSTPLPTPVSSPPSGATPGPSTPLPISTSTAAATPTTLAVSTPAPSSTTIANSGTISGSQPPGATSNQGNLMFWIVLIGLLVLAAGGSGVVLVLRKRARVAPTPATATHPLSEDG